MKEEVEEDQKKEEEEEEGMVLKRRSKGEGEEMRVKSMVCNPQG